MRTGASRRPRPRARIVIDPNNAYARLGVSPLLGTEDIRAFISNLRGKVVGARRGQAAQGFGAAEAEMARLQEIEAEIGTPRARLAYDQAHPQNELLTVQPGPDDRRFEPRERANLVAAWLGEELGPGGLFPSPECRALWSLGGIDGALAEVLARFERDTTGSPRPVEETTAIDAEQAPEVSDLALARRKSA
jgi:hypothetical protein